MGAGVLASPVLVHRLHKPRPEPPRGDAGAGAESLGSDWPAQGSGLVTTFPSKSMFIKLCEGRSE